MKILFISHYSFLYGSNKSLESLIDCFRSQGDDVEVMLPSEGEFYKHLVGKGVCVHIIRFFYEVLYYKWNIKYLSLPLLWLYNLLVFPVLLYRVKKISPDIIYSNSSADLYSIWIAKILSIRHVIHVREFMEQDFGGRCIFGRSFKRMVLTKSDKAICVSKAVANTVFGHLPSNAKVIYNGLPVDNIPEYDYPKLKKTLRIGVVGNIDISKRQDLAISYMPEILSAYPYATLHIIGDKECPYKKQIQVLVKELNLSGFVIFEGFVRNVEDIYSKFDILLMCSRSEAFGRVTIEAMLRKKPVIGYMAGGTTELIDDGETGYKFKDVEDVLAALKILIEDEAMLRKIVDNAALKAKEKFSEASYTKNVYDFIINTPWSN